MDNGINYMNYMDVLNRIMGGFASPSVQPPAQPTQLNIPPIGANKQPGTAMTPFTGGQEFISAGTMNGLDVPRAGTVTQDIYNALSQYNLGQGQAPTPEAFTHEAPGTMDQIMQNLGLLSGQAGDIEGASQGVDYLKNLYNQMQALNVAKAEHPPKQVIQKTPTVKSEKTPVVKTPKTPSIKPAGMTDEEKKKADAENKINAYMISWRTKNPTATSEQIQEEETAHRKRVYSQLGIPLSTMGETLGGIMNSIGSIPSAGNNIPDTGSFQMPNIQAGISQGQQPSAGQGTGQATTTQGKYQPVANPQTPTDIEYNEIISGLEQGDIDIGQYITDNEADLKSKGIDTNELRRRFGL